MNSKRKKISTIIISAAITLTTALVLTSCVGVGPFGNNQDGLTEQGIEIFELERGDIVQTVATTGSVDSSIQNKYALQVSGEIISALEKGDFFKEGELLVEVDDSDVLDRLEQIARDIENAESSLRTAWVNYQKALDANHIAVQLTELNTEGAERSTESALVSLETANRSAQLSLESAQRALESAQDVESAENTVESIKSSNRSSRNQAETSYEQSIDNQSTTYWNNLSSLQTAEAQIAITSESIKQVELIVEAAKIELESVNENLQDYKLSAPYDGIVLASDFRTGEQASGSAMISVISDEFIIEVTVSENDISKISIGNEVLITLDAYSDLELEGRVFKMIPLTINDSGVISFEVLIEFEIEEDINIYYGLSANASIITHKAEDVLYVPIQSVYKEGEKSYVDLLISDQADMENVSKAIEKVEVTTGINDYLYIEVISGLKEGDIIVTSRIK
ncbi:MAG: HlyD family secretion protein [Actinomycetia bacterium]|nr:HlyD family secretion protein [Actinomycetes bacterium]